MSEEIQKQVEAKQKRERERALLQAAATLLGPVVTDEVRAVAISTRLMEIIEGPEKLSIFPRLYIRLWMRRRLREKWSWARSRSSWSSLSTR